MGGRLAASCLVTVGLDFSRGQGVAAAWLLASAALELTLLLVVRRLARADHKRPLRLTYLAMAASNNLLWAGLGVSLWEMKQAGSQFLALIAWASLLVNAASFSFQSPLTFATLLAPVAATMLLTPVLSPKFHEPQQAQVMAGLLMLVGYVALGARRNRAAAQEVRRSEDALRSALAGAQAASEAKSAFLAVMSHEIRTPLNGVIGMAQAMARDALSETQRSRLDIVRRSSETLLGLLNDLLDLSRIEAGRMELEDGVVEPAVILEAARATFAALAVDKGLGFAAEPAPGLAPAYRGDPTRVRQIVTNLVSNAVKFTDQGSVRLLADQEGDELRLRVVDTGPGVPEDRLEALFDRFVQADASTTRRYGGSGLGLAICRELAQAMGGGVTVESVVGAGSTFTLRLPAIRTEPATTPPQADPARHDDMASPLRVLAAEDNATNRLVLSTLLGQVGVELTLAADGAQAVAAWEAAEFDLVLMDVQMPVMDGLAAARAIRAREASTGRRTPIIALTANAMAHHVQEYRDAGMDGFSPKPIQLAALLAEMERALDAAADATLEAAA